MVHRAFFALCCHDIFLLFFNAGLATIAALMRGKRQALKGTPARAACRSS